MRIHTYNSDDEQGSGREHPDVANQIAHIGLEFTNFMIANVDGPMVKLDVATEEETFL